MDWSTSLPMQLVLLTREGSGHLKRDGFIAATLRAATLVDLAFAERIERGEQTRIACAPVGFAPFDRLLTAIRRHPDRTLGWWVGKGPDLQLHLAEEWVRLGGWAAGDRSLLRPGRRYRLTGADLATRAVPHLRAHLQAVVAGELPTSPADAALAALAQIARLVEDPNGIAGINPPRVAVLRGCGPVRWLVEETAAFMIDARRRTVDPVAAGSSTPDGGA